MSVENVTDIFSHAIYVIILTASPLLLISLLVGLIVSIFQTVTSIQEQTLTFVPKLLAIFAGMMLLGHWMLNNMVGYMAELWEDFTVYIR